jgi:hypothetical protein
MSVESKLEVAFSAYVDLAKAELHLQQTKPSTLVPFTVIRNRASELRRLVDELETRDQFRELVQKTLVAFPREDTDDAATSRMVELGNFLRRSKCYVSLYDGEEIDTATIFEYLLAEFRKEAIQTRYLVPLRSVGFSDEVIEFNDFQIRRFSAEELEMILQNNVNEIFFESSFIDVKEIEGYWFLDVKSFGPRLRLEASVDEDGRIWLGHGAIQIDEPESFSLADETAAFPNAVTIALEPLILFDWDSVENMFSFRGVSFDIPFVLRIDDDLLNRPFLTPEVPAFQVGPFFPDYVEELTANDYYIFIDDLKITGLRTFVDEINLLLRRLDVTAAEWNFLHVALLFFRKAFFTPGLQQLLGHITVIEALLGEKKEGLTTRLAKRLGLILGNSEKERREVKKSFDEIYDLRSTFVHGNEKLLDQMAKENHLHSARKLARQTLVWFLHYLNHVIDKTSISKQGEIGLPAREDLLNGLDIEVGSRERIKHLLGILPADFPRTPGWLDQ